MKKALKVILLIMGIYLLIGIAFGISYWISYNPSVTSYPNDFVMFLLNVFLWPMNRF